MSPAESDSELGREVAALEAVLDRDEEARGVGAVDYAVVVAQREVDHRPDSYGVAAGIADDYRLLRHDAGSEDRGLREEDDRGVEQRAARAGVGQRERSAGELVGLELVVAGAGCQVGRASCRERVSRSV